MNQYVIIAIVWAASLGAVGWWQNSAGHTAEKVAWQKRDNDELRAANAKIHALEEAARETERRHGTELAKIATDHEKDRTDAAAQKERDVAAARAGALRLRIPSPCKGPARGQGSSVAAAPGERNGGATAELPGEVAAFLLGLADDADEVVRQLTACQAVVRSDRS